MYFITVALGKQMDSTSAPLVATDGKTSFFYKVFLNVTAKKKKKLIKVFINNR